MGNIKILLKYFIIRNLNMKFIMNIKNWMKIFHRKIFQNMIIFQNLEIFDDEYYLETV